MGIPRQTRAEPAGPRRFTASFAFRCGCCEERYEPGTLAVYARGGELVAVECPNMPDAEPNLLVSTTRSGDSSETYVPDEAEQAAARKAMCHKCFLVHAPLQEECA